MATLIAHGFVHTWSRNMGMSKPKEAYIGKVERKKNIRLLVYFSTGESTTFQLTNNIKNVVLRSYGGKQNHLHLTFQNNSFLFIEGLSSADAEELKMFLDGFPQNNQPSMKPVKDGGIFARTTTQKEINKSSSHEICSKSSSGSLEAGEGHGTAGLQQKPLCASRSSTLTCNDLPENGQEKRKRMLSSGSGMGGKFLQKNSSVRDKKSETNLLRYVSHNRKKKLRLKNKKKLAFEHLFKTDSTENPYLQGVSVLQVLCEKIYLAFLLEAKYSADKPEWDRLKMTLDLYPEKLLQGLPNLGNTCYMNAVLQSLFSIPSFADDLFSKDSPWGKIPLDALSICLAQLFVLKDIYNIKIKERLLVSLKKTISSVAEIFSDNVQNDAHEFLGHCLDQMKESMGKLNTIWKAKIESEEENPAQQIFPGSAATEVLVCPVINNFEFELLRSITCQACGHVVLKTEVNNYLSINLPQGTKSLPLSIQSAFDLFFGAEELEYKCGKCKHKSSVAVHKFSRLPRVLIVHLKRYTFDEFWSLRKDDQEVVISTHLDISSHCNETTKPPPPVSKNVLTRDFQILKVFHSIKFGNFFLSTPSTKPTLASNDSLIPHIGPDKESEPQKCQILCEGSNGEQKEDLGKCPKLNITESELVNLGNGAVIEKELLAAGLMMDLEATSLSQIQKDEGKLTSGPDRCLAKVYLQEMFENLKQKKYETTNTLVDFKSGTETIEDTYKREKNGIPKESQKPTKQTQQDEWMKIYEQALRQALLGALLKTRTRWYAKNLRKPAKLRLQEAKANSLGATGSNKNPGNKECLNKEKSETEATKPKRSGKMSDLDSYRLIGVVSHLGKTPNSGHYISDAYDFERQAWFTYNDLQVLSIEEDLMQEARLCTGYIFFYMHNDVFEELLKREENFQSRNTKAGKTTQEK
ncbi:ubiquitin carboxyl-terminal hydrolase 26 [Prionailurus bengalensis]|uniref:ubiquitin carboxyl-terminal hydrolase 26 n=1 Tax=Prionailurus bengalensis TaxID=37029 RepID=UPI001CA9D0D4|nr:ubiquitin carboxyl-terminal hydrolase 26 [Prionailurus bengalensis]